MSISDSGQPSRFRALLNRLRTSTILGDQRPHTPVPDSVITALRDAADPSAEDPHIAAAPNPYEYARRRLNKIWKGREAYENTDKNTDGKTPVSEFTTMRGAVTAYWTCERAKSAWLHTGTILGLSAFSAQTGVWMAETTGQMANAVSQMDMWSVVNGAKMLVLLGSMDIANSWVQSHSRDFLERDMRSWVLEKFREALFISPDTASRLTHNTDSDSGAADAMPDNPHQRINEAPSKFAQNLISMGDTGASALITSAVVANALYQHSVPIDMLGGLGEYGSFIVSCAVVGGYVTASAPLAMKLSKAMEPAIERLDKASGRLDKLLVNVFDNADTMAAAQGHKTADAMVAEAMDEVTKADAHRDHTRRVYNLFNNIQYHVGNRGVTLIPAFVTTFGNKATAAPVQTFFQTHQMVIPLLFALTKLSDLIPEFSRLRIDTKRIVEMAQMFETARDKKAFFQLSGIHDFEYGTLPKDSDTILQVSEFELMHREKQDAFVRAPDIAVQDGDWVHMRGVHGAGKSKFLSAMSGQWPYGRGTFAVKENTVMFLGYQKVDLSQPYTLAQQLIYGMKRPNQRDISADEKTRMLEALDKVGLSVFKDYIDRTGIAGKSWNKIFSGGQTNMLILARILFQKPDVILLDEPTSGLDQAARVNFFKMLKAGCPHATVIAITHDGLEHLNTEDEELFNKEITLENGVATIAPMKRPEQPQPQASTQTAPALTPDLV